LKTGNVLWHHRRSAPRSPILPAQRQYTVPGIWYLLRGRGWTCQVGAWRAIEPDDGMVEVWKKQTWPSPERRARGRAGYQQRRLRRPFGAGGGVQGGMVIRTMG